MKVLGLMSGSSLDGLDMALCSFSGNPTEKDFHLQIIRTHHVRFPKELEIMLQECSDYNPIELFKTNIKFSEFVSEQCNIFSNSIPQNIDLISSHGHTIFHFPEDKFTFQLGNGAIISQLTNKDVICDFRSSDMGAGGTGAPCAPIADLFLFPDYDIFLNLGGISNISFRTGDNNFEAFDVSPCNQLLNYLAQKKGLVFDEGGNLASNGNVLDDLLDKLIHFNEFSGKGPRALDNNWVRNHFFDLLDQIENIEDGLRTAIEFISLEIEKAISINQGLTKGKKILTTGGGAFNNFLIDTINSRLQNGGISIDVPSDQIVEFKEAILIALMGYLRYKKLPNVLSSVTGATHDTSGGSMYIYL